MTTQAPANTLIRKLILLPGMDGTGKLLAPFVEALNGRLETTVLDYPRHEKLSYVELIRRIEGQIPSSGEPFALLAESFAGPIGLTLAQKQHPGLRALILAVTFGATPRKLLIQLTRVLPLSWLLAMPVPCWMATRIMMGGDAPKEASNTLCSVLKEIEPEVIAARFDEVRDLELEPQAIHLPVMYLQATKDLLLPAASAVELSRYVPEMEIHKVEGGHLVLDTEPQTCAALVMDFLARVSQAVRCPITSQN